MFQRALIVFLWNEFLFPELKKLVDRTDNKIDNEMLIAFNKAIVEVLGKE